MTDSLKQLSSSELVPGIDSDALYALFTALMKNSNKETDEAINPFIQHIQQQATAKRPEVDATVYPVLRKFLDVMPESLVNDYYRFRNPSYEEAMKAHDDAAKARSRTGK